MATHQISDKLNWNSLGGTKAFERGTKPYPRATLGQSQTNLPALHKACKINISIYKLSIYKHNRGWWRVVKSR